MKQPPLEDLLQYADSRYTLVVASAKRARSILEGAEPMTRIDSNKPVSIALAEMVEGKISYHRTKESIK